MFDLSPAAVTLIVLVIMAVLFITEKIPLAITAMGGAVSLAVLGVITPQAAFSGLANSTVVLFAGMFVIGATLFQTGLAHKVGELTVRAFGKGESSLMLGTMIIAAIMSAISSNTGTTAALMPVVIGICAAAKIPSSRQLMPLAFGAGLGGTITLVGTPPNLIANGFLATAKMEPFGFFEFAKIGIPITIVGIAYMMFIGKHLLPKHAPSELAAEAAEAAIAAEEDVIEHRQDDPKKMWISGIILIAVVVVMALDIKRLPLQMAAVIGALLCVLTGCIKEKQAYQGIDWVTIFLFAGMMPVASALDKSGAGKLIADSVISMMGGNPSPYVVCFTLFILSAGLTQFMSNTAATALLCPIGLAISQGIGVAPHSVLMTIAIAASCAFSTPVGTPPNTMVLGAGHYRFMDYLKVGTPLVLILMVVCCVLIPMIWPFN